MQSPTVRLPVRNQEYDQLALTDIDQPLIATTFCVVDLETTGGSASDLDITEIGAVKVRGGEVIGEFHTLVNPGRPIPAFISVLTGITDLTVATAPALSAIFGSFMDFAHDCVMVAHNAGFDIGYLKAAAHALDYAWANPPVLDTVKLSRALLSKSEVRNHKLGTLAQYFHSPTTPTHRALDDARATVVVLHGLFERLGSLGVVGLNETLNFSSKVTSAQISKRHLANDLPQCPGAYFFQDQAGKTLYVGTSTNIRKRVRTYFTASEKRARMSEMIAAAQSVQAVPCATTLEAAIRELRLIAEHQPPYNRRSKFPERQGWLKLTDEFAPRISQVRSTTAANSDGASYLGPLPNSVSRRIAVTLQQATGLRSCTERLSPRSPKNPCSAAELGQCAAPCRGEQMIAAYLPSVALARAVFAGDTAEFSRRMLERISQHSRALRFENAAELLQELTLTLTAIAKWQERTTLANIPQLVFANPIDSGWDIQVVRYGRLAGAHRLNPNSAATDQIEAAIACAEYVAPASPTKPAALAEETDVILRALRQPGVRLVDLTDGHTWNSPLASASADLWRLGQRKSATPTDQLAAIG